jgi:hypothetical protein
MVPARELFGAWGLAYGLPAAEHLEGLPSSLVERRVGGGDRVGWVVGARGVQYWVAVVASLCAVGGCDERGPASPADVETSAATTSARRVPVPATAPEAGSSTPTTSTSRTSDLPLDRPERAARTWARYRDRLVAADLCAPVYRPADAAVPDVDDFVCVIDTVRILMRIHATETAFAAALDPGSPVSHPCPEVVAAVVPGDRVTIRVATVSPTCVTDAVAAVADRVSEAVAGAGA